MNGIRLIDYLGHMLDASNLAYGYVRRLSKEEFLADKRTQQAVILVTVHGPAGRGEGVGRPARWLPTV